MTQLPNILSEFCRKEGININNYNENLRLPRFVRVGKKWKGDITASSLSNELDGIPVESVSDMDDMFRLNGDVKIVHMPSYIAGKIHGIDLSSALAVHALDLDSERECHVLDLCCAPGAKLCYIADRLQPLDSSDSRSTVTGVDISKHRISTCKKMLRKSRSCGVRLFCTDGTTFDVHRPATFCGKDIAEIACFSEQDGGNVCFVKPFDCDRRWRMDPQRRHPSLLYDRVLVDAECTHDGSIAHVRKAIRHDEDAIGKSGGFLSPEHMNSVADLQLRLLENGWRLLKPGGILVYATCSLTQTQNEAVISRFVQRLQDNGQVDSICFESVWSPPLLKRCPAKLDGLINAHIVPWEFTLRLEPIISGVSGMFVAKMTKKSML